MTDGPKIEVVKVQALDTGIGREAGFRDDADLIEVALAERAALPAVVRDVLDEADELFERAVLFGHDSAIHGFTAVTVDGERIDPADLRATRGDT